MDSIEELVRTLSGLSGQAWTEDEAKAFRTLMDQAGWDLHSLDPAAWRVLLEQAKPFCTELGRVQRGDESAKGRLLSWAEETLSRAGEPFPEATRQIKPLDPREPLPPEPEPSDEA